MIDWEARGRAQELMQDLLACAITNRQFEAGFTALLGPGRTSADRGVIAAYGFFWNLYDDLEEHKLEGEHAPEPGVLEIAERCMLFMDTGFEYRWKKMNFIGLNWRRMLARILPWIRYEQNPVVRFGCQVAEPGGDVAAWPFYCIEDYSAKLAELDEPILGPALTPLSKAGQK